MPMEMIRYEVSAEVNSEWWWLWLKRIISFFSSNLAVVGRRVHPAQRYAALRGAVTRPTAYLHVHRSSYRWQRTVLHPSYEPRYRCQ